MSSLSTPQSIHPMAVVDPSARLGEGVVIGPFCIVGKDVEIGAGTILHSHAVLEDHTIIGENCEVSPGAVLGGAPQDLNYKGEPTRVRIGNGTKIRECVTVNRATGEGTETVVGNDCMLMAYSHLAHNCWTGNHVILANAVQVGGHVRIDDYAFLGGACVVHQHSRIGRMAFIGGFSAARQDIPPFSINDGRITRVRGTNHVGLRRRGMPLAERQRLKQAFQLLFFSDLNHTQAIATIRDTMEMDANLTELITFIETSKRGLAHSKNRAREESDDAKMDNELDLMPV